MTTLRRTALGILLLAVAWNALAAPAPWRARVWTDHPVRLELSSRAELAELLAAVPVASFDREQLAPLPGGRILWQPRVTDAEESGLRAAGYAVERLPDRERAGREAVEAAWSARRPGDKAQSGILTDYPTHAEIGQILAQAAADHSGIARAVSWGQSVEGREMWGIVISDDVQNTEAEPEVRLTSSMHGDEVVGMVMLLNLVEHLTDNYGVAGQEDVTALVDGTELHILPLHNPDGYAAGWRYNSNFVDLNRNFGEPAGTHPVLEQENANFQAYSQAQHFVVSGNGHGGALVVNYAWDWTYVLAPDNAALIELSHEYADLNPPMSASPYFPGGVTHGATWYVATGTLQDWSYDQTGCIDLTLELSDSKWPPAATLAGFWEDNRASLRALVAAARWGVGGVVTDATTGLPLDATVTVAGNAMAVVTDPAHGDYYKLLPSGTWDLTFSAAGYDPLTITDVATVWGTATVVDAALQPDLSDVPAAAAPLLAARPNPFNPSTVIVTVNPNAGPVDLEIFDLAGRRVRTLVRGERRAGGEHADRWDGRDDRGRLLAGGVYYARLSTTAGRVGAKLTLVK